uniref:IkappaB kinase n=1 Tax=Eptatretus burgeri TaxID=7764 RepID=A0A8C4Q9L3_EPTBU
MHMKQKHVFYLCAHIIHRGYIAVGSTFNSMKLRLGTSFINFFFSYFACNRAGDFGTKGSENMPTGTESKEPHEMVPRDSNHGEVLNNPENCCGMKENDVMMAISDIASAVQYLHKNRIIHRDLKPENIVLQTQEERVLYKIIDLGYAKELDQGSLCTSFVGTLQYLAPELFEGQKYTVTVDYWSFATVVFECITGYRPFLPNMHPVQWHRIVRTKDKHDIVAIEEMNRNIKFSSHIPIPHNLNPVLAGHLEHWLQLVLCWNPSERGGGIDAETGRPNGFLILDTILRSKTLHVLNMVSGDILAYPVRAEESLQALHVRLEDDAHIPLTQQDLLLDTGIALDPRRSIGSYLLEQTGWNTPLVYLFDKSMQEPGGHIRSPRVPDLVGYIVAESKVLLTYMQRRKAWGQAYHHIRGLREHHSRLQQGQRAAMLSLLRHNGNLTKLKNMAGATSHRLQAKVEFFRASVHLDLEKYGEQTSTGISSEKLHSAWLEMESEAASLLLEGDLSELDEMCVQSKIVELQRSPNARRQADILENT